MELTGGCLCGAVRYKATTSPLVTRVCWCRLCQYLAAGNGTVNAAFLRDSMTIEGPYADYRSVADSGNVMHRSFCPACGTALFSEAESRPHIIIVRVGTLDDPELARPQATIWTSQAPSWACMDETLPQIPAQPPPAA